MSSKSNLGVDTPNAPNAPNALLLHCIRVYNFMLSEAVSRYNDEGEEVIIWEGMLVNLITNKLNLSVPYYTSITNALKRMGCASQLKRGGGTSASIWQLHHSPSQDLYENATSPKQKVNDWKRAQQEQIDGLAARIANLERILDKFIQQEISHGRVSTDDI